MAEAFPVSGNIDPQSFPHLLVDLHRHGATGSLKVNGPVHPKALYFRGGRVLFGSSNDPKDQLGAILIESGRITRDQLDEVNAKVGPGNPLAKVLAESGFVNQRELGEAARMKVERILADVLSWDSGTFEFEDGVLPKGAVDLKLSTEKLLLAAVQRVSDRPFALRHLELSTVLEPSPDGESALSEVRADVWPLLERLDGRRTLKDAVALTRLDEFEAVKTACAMLFLGIVRKKDVAATSGEVDLAEAAQSAFEKEETPGPMYTMPLTPVAAAEHPAASGFAFSEPAPSGFPPPEPEPTPAAAAPAPRPEPFPEVEPVPEEPPVFSVETTMLPGAAPIFTMADYLKRAEEQGKAEQRMAFEPKGQAEEASPETVYAMPSPPMALSPPPPAETAYSAPAPPPEPPTFTPEPPHETPYNPFTATSAVADAPTSVPYNPFAAASPTPEPPAIAPAPEPAPVPSYAAYSGDDEPTAILPERPEIPAPPAQAPRPSQEDLAALDALLNPANAAKAGTTERPRQERFEPQFRPPTTPPRKPAARNAPASRSRIPLIAAGLAGVVLATVAAWYFLLRTPESKPSPAPVPPPTTVAAVPTTTLPPATLAPAATPTPVAAVAPAATPAATPVAATPTPKPTPAATPAPTPRPAPTATPKPAAAAHGPGEGRALLRQGSFPEAAKSFAASLSPGARGRFSHQLLTACATETIAKAVQAVPDEDLFILPVTFQGKSCYRLCWGVYDTRAAAEAARNSVPSYFRQGGTTPRLSPLNELIP